MHTRLWRDLFQPRTNCLVLAHQGARLRIHLLVGRKDSRLPFTRVGYCEGVPTRCDLDLIDPRSMLLADTRENEAVVGRPPKPDNVFDLGSGFASFELAQFSVGERIDRDS